MFLLREGAADHRHTFVIQEKDYYIEEHLLPGYLRRKDLRERAQGTHSIVGKSASLLPTLPVFYLSGSPWALHQRISQAFDRVGLPQGATILRRYSQEPLDPFDFKHPRLLDIVDANPERKWILFGDTGEKDPEVCLTLIRERPGVVDAVFIHNVTNANPQDPRFTDFTVFDDWSEVVAAIQQRKLGLLSLSDS